MEVRLSRRFRVDRLREVDRRGSFYHRSRAFFFHRVFFLLNNTGSSSSSSSSSSRFRRVVRKKIGDAIRDIDRTSKPARSCRSNDLVEARHERSRRRTRRRIRRRPSSLFVSLRFFVSLFFLGGRVKKKKKFTFYPHTSKQKCSTDTSASRRKKE